MAVRCADGETDAGAGPAALEDVTAAGGEPPKLVRS